MRTFTMIKTAVATLAVAVLASTSFAGIAGSDHDFSTGAMGLATGGQICLPCHTPHNANVAAGKLWNHAIDSTAVYTLYGGSTTTTALDLDPTSRLCLSCHDGVTANVDAFGGSLNGAAGTFKIAGGAQLGTDLSNDHPIGDKAAYSTYKLGTGATYTWTDTRMKDLTGTALRLRYTVTNPSLATPAAGAVTTGKGVVSCYTCHNPHDNQYGTFLRVSNTGSGLCLTCHNK